MMRSFMLLVLMGLGFQGLFVVAEEEDTFVQPKLPVKPLQYQSSVVKLVDRNFEHQTQASTGMTTGSWLIWFYKSRGGTGKINEITDTTKDPHVLVEGDQPESSFWTEHNIVLSSAHVQLSTDTIRRFQLPKPSQENDSDDGYPLFVFLHKHKYYVYDGPLEWESIVDFCLHGYQKVPGKSIPAPRNEFVKVLAILLNDFHPSRLLIVVGVLVVLGGLLYALSVLSIMGEPNNSVRKMKKRD